MKTAGLGSVGASGALRQRADWICEQGIDFRSRPETLFRSAKILKHREVAGERTWGLALAIGVAAFQEGWVVERVRPGAMRGDYLTGGAAGNAGHAVELPCKTAGPGGRRAQLHDQLADLGFPHHGADAIPSRPALAGIKAENLAAPPREDG